jgi:hypothetical protein
VSFPEDQHPVRDFAADGQHEAFGEAVRPRATVRDLDHLDARIGQYGVERGRELSGPIADEEPEPCDVFAEVHDEVAGLLGGPGAVGMRGHAQDVQVIEPVGARQCLGQVVAPPSGRPGSAPHRCQNFDVRTDGSVRCVAVGVAGRATDRVSSPRSRSGGARWRRSLAGRVERHPGPSSRS